MAMAAGLATCAATPAPPANGIERIGVRRSLASGMLAGAGEHLFERLPGSVRSGATSTVVEGLQGLGSGPDGTVVAIGRAGGFAVAHWLGRDTKAPQEWILASRDTPLVRPGPAGTWVVARDQRMAWLFGDAARTPLAAVQLPWIAVDAAVAPDGALLVGGAADSRLMRVEPDGTVAQVSDTTQVIERLALFGGKVWVLSPQGVLRSFDPTGTTQAGPPGVQVTLPGAGVALAAGAGLLIAATADLSGVVHLLGIDPADGAVRWTSSDLPDGPRDLVVVAGVACFGAPDALHRVDAATGVAR